MENGIKFTEQELREKGGKNVCLEYIFSQDPSIPLPEKISESEISEGMLRSDHWRELDDFFGIFESTFIGRDLVKPSRNFTGTFTNVNQAKNYIFMKETGMPEIDEDLKYRRKFFDAYCTAKGLNPQEVLSELRILPQKRVHSNFKGTMLLHPNVPSRYFLSVSSTKSSLDSFGFVFDSDEAKVDYPIKECLAGRLVEGFSLEEFKVKNLSVNDLYSKIFSLYKKIISMPKFQDGFSWMMEFSFEPEYVLQMRRFRKIEDGSNLTCSWKNEKGVLKTDFSVGVTPSEGIVLPYFNGALVPGPQMLYPGFNDEIHKFNNEHPTGFIYNSMEEDQYSKTFLSNAFGVLKEDILHTTDHGGFESLSSMPISLFYLKGLASGRNYHKQNGINIPSGTNVRVFANGREGYVKLED